METRASPPSSLLLSLILGHEETHDGRLWSAMMGEVRHVVEAPSALVANKLRRHAVHARRGMRGL